MPRCRFPRVPAGPMVALLANAGSLMGTTVVTSGFGFLFWAAAARLFGPATVGFSAAAVSAMNLLGTAAMLGLGTLLVGELPRRPGKAASLIGAALVVSAFAGAALGAVFSILAPALSGSLLPLAGLGSLAVFSCGVALTAASLVLDQAVIGLLLGGVQFARNLVFAVSKLLLLVAVGSRHLPGGDGAIVAVWVVGIVVSLIVLPCFASPATAGASLRPDLQAVRGLGRAALLHHFVNLALQAPGLLLPLVVVYVLSPAANAVFYGAWMITAFVLAPPTALAMTLYAVGAADPAVLWHQAAFTLRWSAACALAAVALVWLLAPVALLPFGPSYAIAAAPSLRILVWGSFPATVKFHYVAVKRATGTLVSAAPLFVLGLLLEVALPTLGALRWGLPGLSLGWVIAMSFQALLMAPATVGPLLRRHAPH